jgi:hypothetical protein
MNLKGHALGLYRRWAHFWLWPVLWYEERKPIYAGRNERGVEWAYALDVAARQSGTTALDVGTGWTCWPYLLYNCGYRVTAVDLWDRDFVRKFGGNRHYRVRRMDIAKADSIVRLMGETRGQQYDLITCISTLEHMPVGVACRAMSHMAQLLSAQGVLVTTFPYGPQRAQAQERPFTQVYSEMEMNQFAEASGLGVIGERYYSCWTGGCWRAQPRREVCRKVPMGSRVADLVCATWRRRRL